METIIEQGNYYRVVERDGKYYPEFITISAYTDVKWLPYQKDGKPVELNSKEEVQAFWQKKEF